MGELEWFDAYCKLDNAPGAAEETLELIRKAESDAARKGVVGIRDYEMAENVDTWTRRFSAASPRPRDANDSAWTGIDWDGIHPRHPRIARGGGRVSRTAGGCD